MSLLRYNHVSVEFEFQNSHSATYSLCDHDKIPHLPELNAQVHYSWSSYSVLGLSWTPPGAEDTAPERENSNMAPCPSGSWLSNEWNVTYNRDHTYLRGLLHELSEVL